MNELISIIVPVYNVEKYLNRCIESLVRQTYKNLEIILIDDGSQDSSPLICDKWKEKDSRIKVLHKSNGGLSDARNAGIEMASGEYIAFVDSDDYVELDMYETMLEAAIRYRAKLICCGRNIVSNNCIKEVQHMCHTEVLFSGQEALAELLCYGSIEEAAWDKLYYSSLFDGIRFPKGEINEDIVIMPSVFELCDRVVHVGKSFYNYCQNPGTITKSAYTEKLSVCISHIKYVAEYIEKEYPNLRKELKIFKARYSLALVTTMLGSENATKVYASDYIFYMSLLKKNYKNLLLCSNFSLLTKMRCICIILGVYPFFKKLKDVRIR